MRRFAAHFALAAIWLGIFAPFADAAQVAGEPACCRRAGLHHCQAAGEDSSGNTEFRVNHPVCPYSARLSIASSAGFEPSAFRLASPNAAGSVTAQTTRRGLTQAIFDLSTRGPPVLL
jgi:hypothetical protein